MLRPPHRVKKHTIVHLADDDNNVHGRDYSDSLFEIIETYSQILSVKFSAEKFATNNNFERPDQIFTVCEEIYSWLRKNNPDDWVTSLNVLAGNLMKMTNENLFKS